MNLVNHLVERQATKRSDVFFAVVSSCQMWVQCDLIYCRSLVLMCSLCVRPACVHVFSCSLGVMPSWCSCVFLVPCQPCVHVFPWCHASRMFMCSLGAMPALCSCVPLEPVSLQLAEFAYGCKLGRETIFPYQH